MFLRRMTRRRYARSRCVLYVYLFGWATALSLAEVAGSHAILRDRFLLYVASQQFQRFRGFITYLYLVLCVIRRFIFDRSEKEIFLQDFYTRQHSSVVYRMKPALLSQYSYNILHQFIHILLFFDDTIPRRKISFASSKQTSEQSTRNGFFLPRIDPFLV